MTKEKFCECKEPLRNIAECEQTGDFATKCVLCGKEINDI